MQQLKGISQLIQSSTAMQPTSMFPTGRCRIRLSPVKKIFSRDAAFCSIQRRVREAEEGRPCPAMTCVLTAAASKYDDDMIIIMISNYRSHIRYNIVYY